MQDIDDLEINPLFRALQVWTCYGAL